jgi:voltage-gated potassium channel
MEPSQPAPVLEPNRWLTLKELDEWLDGPMTALALIWTLLLVVELIYGASELFDTLGVVIWCIFVVEFALRFWLAPAKGPFLRKNWLSAIALALPALRLTKLVRVFSALSLRSMTLLRLVATVNRNMKALGLALGKRGLTYVLGLTLILVLVGAAGIYSFERGAGPGFATYGDALWWTAMIVTTMGSEHWPQTPEGRVLCVLLASYAFAVFGYVTAALASFFLDTDAASARVNAPSEDAVNRLEQEIRLLRDELSRRPA